MSSPCTGCCFYDHEKDHCSACFRTLEEIGAWEKMTEAEKHDVVKRCRIKRTYKRPEGAAERSATGLENQGT